MSLTQHLVNMTGGGTAAPSTKDLVKQRLAETRAAGAQSCALQKERAVTQKERAEHEKKTPTKLLQFSQVSADDPMFIKSRNTSQNRSQIFYGER